MTNKLCNLCKLNAAYKQKSHIIPKFMSHRLFESTRPRHTLQINRVGKQKKIQDTPKEKYILCNSCEKKIEILETYFARVFKEINNISRVKSKYTIDKQFGNEVIVCEDLNPVLFKLFIYSIIWRCSISTLFVYQTFKLAPEVEEELRIFLNSNLNANHTDLLSSLDNINNIPQYHFCLIKPINNTRGIFTAYTFGENAYAIYTVDFAIFFYTSPIPLVEKHMYFSNMSNEKVRIVHGKDEEWKALNNIVLRKMLKS